MTLIVVGADTSLVGPNTDPERTKADRQTEREREEKEIKTIVESENDSTADETTLSGELVTKTTPPDDFDAFWAAYPNKQGRVPALRTWRRMKPHERAAALEVATAMSYCVECGYRERDKCPHGSTFLNQRRWDEWRNEDNELRAPPGYGPQGNGAEQESKAAIRRAVAKVYGVAEEDL